MTQIPNWVNDPHKRHRANVKKTREEILIGACADAYEEIENIEDENIWRMGVMLVLLLLSVLIVIVESIILINIV